MSGETGRIRRRAIADALSGQSGTRRTPRLRRRIGQAVLLDRSERFLAAHPELFQHRDQDGVLKLQVTKDDLDLLFRLDVDLEVALRPQLGMATLHVLPHHDERHEQDLNHVAHEEIGHEGREGIERWPAEPRHLARQAIVAAPDDRPEKNEEEKAHRPDAFGDEHGKPIHSTQGFRMLLVDIANGCTVPSYLCKQRWRGEMCVQTHWDRPSSRELPVKTGLRNSTAAMADRLRPRLRRAGGSLLSGAHTPKPRRP